MKITVGEEIVVPELEGAEPDKRFWTEREEAIMRKYYGKTSTKKLAAYLGRTLHAVHVKASFLGIQFRDGGD